MHGEDVRAGHFDGVNFKINIARKLFVNHSLQNQEGLSILLTNFYDHFKSHRTCKVSCKYFCPTSLM